MVVDSFGALLQELSQILAIPLQPDKNNSCLIKFPEGLEIQLEIDHTGQFLILGGDLGDVPSGKYRENIFREALRSNGMQAPHNGVLAYSKQKDHLVIFERLPLVNLTGDKVHVVLAPFVAKAKLWKEALAKGEVPVIPSDGISSSGGSQGMFGLRS